MSEPILDVRNLKTYFYTARGVVRAVDDVSFTLNRGESLGIAGESGCGKSTLAYSLIRLVPPPGKITGGQIIFKGKNVLEMSEEEFRREVRWKGISMVFQGAMNALNPVYTIGDQIAEVLMLHQGYSKKEALETAAKMLQMVGIDPKRLKSYPHELSGGMKQRVVIAMALALNPPIVIADEPTTALDVVVQAQIMNLLKRLKKELGLSIILISHDLSLIAEIADKIAIMYGGEIIEYGPSEAIYNRPMHPYTIGLLGSIPRLHGELRDLTWIPGFPPDLANPPPGCRFMPRCPKAFNKCSEKPPLVEVEPGHYVKCWLYAKG
ncbi:oligopeptide/dipeptide ABC transporter, ATPase subunit [Desulfurococcus amylolyticus 1221n]|uniref:Oligopeptide/dipeptide ABC transporter, ATPase subunit n=1 Tax=Desulfurococcus amylolyticus (strain DSM 18924 / JCM 16383 / VKM B-2413 / 1221n) TaxID=490899 RepID=B8D3N7_DESA1|nr:ABC transporter ATP-binding protein [Desulfurococcus amylolyticus]ACL10718.1 oligopeptide/dipeptide ABC transporter, ATPase subunit [Desulfurococcus amylolyticus 1221n]